MRHLKRTAKLGRSPEHRNAMLANLVCSLIEHKRVTTTFAKAKAARSVAEKMVSLGKKGKLHHRRLAVARLHQEAAAKILFKEIAPAFKERNGGYTRIIKLGAAPGRLRPARDFGMGGFCRARAGTAEAAPAAETKPATETKPDEKKP